MNKIVAIIQARCGSTRFPNKIFSDIDGKPLIWHVTERLKYAKSIDDIVVATTTNVKDNIVDRWCVRNSIKCFRGSENNVLNRYYMATETYPADIIVRITADDPFKEPLVIDAVVNTLIEGHYDYVTNNYPPSYPEGLDCEAFTRNTLITMEKNATEDIEKEHVTQYIFRHLNEFNIKNVSSREMLKNYRWTIDTKEDLQMVREIYNKRRECNKGILLMKEILSIINENPEIVEINAKVHRSLMYEVGEKNEADF